MRFLRCVAQAVVGRNLKALSGTVPLGPALLDIVQDAWHTYRQRLDAESKGGDAAPEARLAADLQALAQAPAEEIRRMATAAAQEAADGLPLEVQQALARYLIQVPAMIHRSLRRPADPVGTTVPSNLAFRGPDDLLPLLPPKLPDFEPGYQPVAGVAWELEELLGAGALGEIWKVRHPDFKGITAVLKFCPDEAAAQTVVQELVDLDRLLQYGRPPGIVPLRQVYLDAEPVCLEYEFIRGGDLGGMILRLHQQQAASPDRVARLVHRLALTLRPAHRLKPALVHRGLKPANVLVRRAENNDLDLLISDFGASGTAAARAIAAAARGGARGENLAAVLRGAFMPFYASPQQLRGEPPDPRDDIYALGIIWYQLLTGDLRHGRPAGRGWRHPLAERGMSAGLLDLLEACMDEDADARPDDAGQLVERLEALLRQQQPEPRPVAPPAPPSGRTGLAVKHGNVVRAVAFTPDGKLAASACFDGTVRVWDTTTGAVQHLWTVPGQNGAVAVSPDGRMVVAGNSGGKLCAWDLATGQARYVRPSGQGNVYALVFSADGLSLASANHTGTIGVWDPLAGRLRHLLTGHKGRVWGVAFSPDGQTLASGGEDGTVRLWDPAAGEETNRLTGHEQHVCAVAFSPDGRFLASGGDDGSVRLWELATGLEVLRIATTPTSAVAFSPDGRLLVSADKRIAAPEKQNEITLWELPTGKRLVALRGHVGPVYAVVFSPDGRRLASGGDDGTARIWPLEELARRAPVPPPTLTARQLEELWAALADEDAAAAYQAAGTLAAAPSYALALFERRLQPVPLPDAEQQKELEQHIVRLIGELEDEDQEVRHQAMEELQRIGPTALPILERLRDTAASRRTINQVALLLGSREEKLLSLDEIRGLRAVAVLEQIGNEAAQQLLQRLSEGDPQAALTREARIALDRLTRVAP
ncbi:MAG TPA: WD40 repeat domain-containing serine/threonine-protein kinase [Gemmataceae bacterium]|nr:WD40 repeat domain-containing serine/threonine-protein kinase [Gemmataceae bacterium]